MDTFTTKLLDAWLERTERENMWTPLKRLMLDVFDDDPEYWGNQEWSKLREVAVPQDTYNCLMAEAELQADVDDMAGER